MSKKIGLIESGKIVISDFPKIGKQLINIVLNSGSDPLLRKGIFI